jgi:hypothetical protein
MQPQTREQFVFWHDAGPLAAQFGRLHGKPLDLALLASDPALRQALLTALPPTLRLVAIRAGRIRRLDHADILDWVHRARGEDGYREG